MSGQTEFNLAMSVGFFFNWAVSNCHVVVVTVILFQDVISAQVAMEAGFEPWTLKRTAILSNYTTSESIPITTVRAPNLTDQQH